MNNHSLFIAFASLATALPAFAGGCCGGGSYWGGYMLVGTVVWLLLGSALLFYTWNTVVADLLNCKKASFQQALLFLVTMAVLCAPKHMMMNHMGCSSMHCHDEKMGDMDKGGDANPDATRP